MLCFSLFFHLVLFYFFILSLLLNRSFLKKFKRRLWFDFKNFRIFIWFFTYILIVCSNIFRADFRRPSISNINLQVIIFLWLFFVNNIYFFFWKCYFIFFLFKTYATFLELNWFLRFLKFQYFTFYFWFQILIILFNLKLIAQFWV